ncbi:Uncharacterised protein [Mycobacteroides abscessus subsp. abscessus]|nr:Uncharacterised protein [Mycobacteroides abscessus subsp. abscessus]
MTMAKNPPDLTANTGNTRTPTTFFSVRPAPGNCVCLPNHNKTRWTAMRPKMIAGMINTWSAYIRGMMVCPGKSPPNRAQCSQVPMTGMPRVIEDSAARRPIPESRSSGSE